MTGVGTLKEVFACDYGPTWIWVHGHVDKRKFKGQCLSKVSSGGYNGLDGEGPPRVGGHGRR